ncbi:MAG TPA: hydrogenase formation protein HypD, partial [Bryobacteraceae bacterium]|nr:hydrogenase formation protein HypD [Bryobacteraceae bacterium]
MKFIDEYRDRKAVELLAGEIRRAVTRPWTIMEICGGQTHTILKSGLQDLLPPEVTLVHGPGCPVCVTPIELIDKAVDIALRPGAILCSFGD